MITRVKQFLRPFKRDQRGAIFIEAILILPVITIFAAGVFEFGNILWQRHHMQVGVRDAARFISRSPSSGTVSCSENIARNIAFTGKPTFSGLSVPRIPGWPADSQAVTNALEFVDVSDPVTGVDRFAVIGRLQYEGSGWMSVLGLQTINIEYLHVQRRIGR